MAYTLATVVIATLAFLHVSMWRMSTAYDNFIRSSLDNGTFVSKRVKHESDSISYLIGGNDKSGTALIGIHGSPGSADNLALYFQTQKLRQQMQIVSYDRRGFGLEKGHEQYNRLAQEVEHLRSIIKYVRADTIIFLAHSYGSSVALKYLANYKDKAYAAVLIGSPIDPKLEKGHWWRRIVNFNGIRWAIPNPLRKCNAEILALRDELTLMENEIQHISHPLLFFHGKNDMLVPVENIDTFKSRDQIKSKHVYIKVEDDGHFIIWSRKTEVVDLIDKLIITLRQGNN